MKIVIQRVKEAKVLIDNQPFSSIGPGLLILLGVAQEDTPEKTKEMAQKIANLRIFPEDDSPERSRRMNRSILDVQGEILVVSQFTLLADTSGGRRPSFIKAADPEKAKELYALFVRELGSYGVSVKTGKFGQYMRVSLVNDGPVTIILDH